MATSDCGITLAQGGYNIARGRRVHQVVWECEIVVEADATVYSSWNDALGAWVLDGNDSVDVAVKGGVFIDYQLRTLRDGGLSDSELDFAARGVSIGEKESWSLEKSGRIEDGDGLHIRLACRMDDAERELLDLIMEDAPETDDG